MRAYSYGNFIKSTILHYNKLFYVRKYTTLFSILQYDNHFYIEKYRSIS